MKNLLILIIIVTCLGLFSCSPSVSIEQEVELSSALTCEYRIKTYVWVKNYPDFGDLLIEKSFYNYNISINKIDEYKIDQMIKAIATKAAVEESFENKPCFE